MAASIGFDNEKYLNEQSRAIVERAQAIGGKLYLEFGGKIAYDFHAARVLPGYDPNVKIRLLQKLRDQAEIIVCIYAGAIDATKGAGRFRHPLRRRRPQTHRRPARLGPAGSSGGHHPL